MEEDFTEESSDGTLVRGDDHSYDAHKFPAKPLLRPGWPKEESSGTAEDYFSIS